MPAGVVNVVPCSRARVQEVGAALCDSPKVQIVSFTGSTEVGQVLNVLLLYSCSLLGCTPFWILMTFLVVLKLHIEK